MAYSTLSLCLASSNQTSYNVLLQVRVEPGWMSVARKEGTQLKGGGGWYQVAEWSVGRVLLKHQTLRKQIVFFCLFDKIGLATGDIRSSDQCQFYENTKSKSNKSEQCYWGGNEEDWTPTVGANTEGERDCTVSYRPNSSRHLDMVHGCSGCFVPSCHGEFVKFENYLEKSDSYGLKSESKQILTTSICSLTYICQHQFRCILVHEDPSSLWKIDSPKFVHPQGTQHS